MGKKGGELEKKVNSGRREREMGFERKKKRFSAICTNWSRVKAKREWFCIKHVAQI